MRRTTVDKLRENLRLQQVYNTFMRYGWDILFDRWANVGDFRRRTQAWVWHLPYELEPVTLPVKVRLMVEELGPTYVKMGQIISSQASVVPPDWQIELDKLQSDVPPFPAEVVRNTIYEELGANPEEIYETFEAEPFAAASTAQVHRATLQGGGKVAVKVQRPFIRNQMKADIGIMQNAARVLTRSSQAAASVDLEGMIDQFGSSVLNELDYTIEAYNSYKLSENMANIPGVHLPVVYPNLSTSRVLTMEFVQGVKITDLDAIDAAGLDRSLIATNALRIYIKQLLIDGFFHADPHPGNLLVDLRTGVINLLDTGMVGELNLNQRLNMIQLLIALRQVDIDSLAQILRNMSTPYVKHVDEQAYLRDFRRRVGSSMLSGAKTPMSEVVSSGLTLLSEHGLRLDPNLTMAIKAMTQAEAVATALYPEGGIVQQGVDMIKDLALQVITAEKVVDTATKQLTMIGRELFKNVPDLSTAALKWIGMFKRGRLEVTVDTSEVAKEVNKIRHLGRMITIALMLAGMIIGSAIATSFMSQEQEGVWDLISRVAYIGYILSMIFAILFSTRLIWLWWRHREEDEED
jgi:ubiquinone biosynthesis protein